MAAPTSAAVWLRLLHLPQLATLCAAAIVALALTVFAGHLQPLFRAPHMEPVAAVSEPVAAQAPQAPPDAPQPAAQAPAPSARRYVVQRGDSLWKIYRTLGSGRAAPTGWAEFLSWMSAENGIGDPDLIQAGRVLTVEPAQP